MTLTRRAFLRSATAEGAAATASAGALLAGSAAPAEALQRPPKPMPDAAVGLLYDSTLCVGCKACVAACKDRNGMPAEIPPRLAGWNEGTWDSPVDLSGRTLTIIKVYQHGTMAEKDREENGFAFIKRQCMHCADPSCVSVCPVTAMTKDPETGIVSHHPERCIGCRYCVLSCPFNVPRYDYDNPFGEIQKCQMCEHLLAEGQLPGCADACPTGATLFGRTLDLKAEAERRLAAEPGRRHAFPRGDINGELGGARPPHEQPIARYQPAVYGEGLLGGTQCLVLSGVPFEKLGLPTRVPEISYAAITEGIQHTLYKYLILPAVLLGGLVVAAFRSARRHPPEEWD